MYCALILFPPPPFLLEITTFGLIRERRQDASCLSLFWTTEVISRALKIKKKLSARVTEVGFGRMIGHYSDGEQRTFNWGR